MQYLGQHFLKNRAVVKKIIDALNLKSGDHVIEIGPGRGALTFPLLAACAEKKCEFSAIERDRRLAAVLYKERPEIEILEGDALEILPGLLKETEDVKIAGNIPYYITGKLLRVLSEAPREPEVAVLMLQREVAERIAAAPPHMNRLAAITQFWADPKMIAAVPKSDFSPPPQVDSAVIALRRRNDRNISKETYFDVAHHIFQQPRKTLLNNLSGFGSREEIANKLTSIHIDPSLRGQDLSPESIGAIAELFSLKA